jgi:hypothetical protein
LLQIDRVNGAGRPDPMPAIPQAASLIATS